MDDLTAHRLGLWQVDAHTAVQQLCQLIEDLFVLVKRHMPQINTENAQARFNLVLNKEEEGRQN